MHPMDPAVKIASCAQRAGNAVQPEGTVTCPSSAQETVPNARLMSVWGMVSHALEDRLCACRGVVPPMPSSARLSGGLGPSLPPRFAFSLPILGGMPLGAVGAALLAATCPVLLEMPSVGSCSARGAWPSLCWAQPRICTGRHWKPMEPGQIAAGYTWTWAAMWPNPS